MVVGDAQQSLEQSLRSLHLELSPTVRFMALQNSFLSELTSHGFPTSQSQTPSRRDIVFVSFPTPVPNNCNQIYTSELYSPLRSRNSCTIYPLTHTTSSAGQQPAITPGPSMRLHTTLPREFSSIQFIPSISTSAKWGSFFIYLTPA